MRLVRPRFDGTPPTWLQPEGLYCRASDAHHLQKVRISNDNFNSERASRIRGPCRNRGDHRQWVRKCKTPDRLRRRDKANWRSLAPFGRKGLSAHWILQVFAASKWPSAMCAGAALRTFPMNFNLPSDGARNVRRGGARYFFAIMRASAT